jgi:hypothetical protein
MKLTPPKLVCKLYANSPHEKILFIDTRVLTAYPPTRPKANLTLLSWGR